MGVKLNLKNVRIGWVNVFEKAADSVGDDGKVIKGKYQATIYIDKDDPQINQLDATVLEVLTEGLKSAKAAEKWMAATTVSATTRISAVCGTWPNETSRLKGWKKVCISRLPTRSAHSS